MINLASALPLASPITLMIDGTNLCGFKCSFCPTGNPELLKEAGRPSGIMSLNTFSKIIDDLQDFPEPPKNIYCYRDGEPTLVKHLDRMIGYAKDNCPTSSVEITTNAAGLTREKSAALLDAGLDRIRVSVEHVTDEGYRRITKTWGDYGRIVANVRAFREERDARKSACQIICKIIDSGLSATEREKFFADFEPLADIARVETLMGWSDTRGRDMTLGADLTTGMDGASPIKADRVACPSPWKTLAIAFNGDCSPCCVDWGHDLVLGNVNTESLYSIWTGQKMRALRMAHLRGERGNIKGCAGCQYVLGMPPESDIDGVRLERLKAMEAGAAG